ncbi:hypothetical protein FRY74_04720 [Vicingus serpentipes]|uniref:Uncharacterized protein n=1 Tax=Vicingus serpentipes TaxID=1926625 RepID=A0A5C6RUW1_9FLAO|nr:hypothetical protein [Vicingus serpentipes]TXB65877.1 hypothetical protein FRY74_04720 [Vicingus serpentipes]
MRNYQQKTQYTSSREYYSSLKNEEKNLNSSKIVLNKTDKVLENILDKTYKVFNPIFKDQNQLELDHISTRKEKEIDSDFDRKIIEFTPSWIISVFNVLFIIYQKLIGKKITKNLKVVKKSLKTVYHKIAQHDYYKKTKEILVTLRFKTWLKTKPT